jgi:hypothetical protein
MAAVMAKESQDILACHPGFEFTYCGVKLVLGDTALAAVNRQFPVIG